MKITYIIQPLAEKQRNFTDGKISHRERYEIDNFKKGDDFFGLTSVFVEVVIKEAFHSFHGGNADFLHFPKKFPTLHGLYDLDETVYEELLVLKTQKLVIKKKYLG